MDLGVWIMKRGEAAGKWTQLRDNSKRDLVETIMIGFYKEIARLLPGSGNSIDGKDFSLR